MNGFSALLDSHFLLEGAPRNLPGIKFLASPRSLLSDIIFHPSFLVMCLEKSTKDWKQRRKYLLLLQLLGEGTMQQLQQQPQAGDVRGRKSTTVN